MMMGALGLLCVHSLGLWRQSPKAARYILSGVCAGFLIFVMFGMNPASDIVAHFGGFVGGMLLGGAMALAPEGKLKEPRYNAGAALVMVALAAVNWAFALRGWG